jgi:predicted DNA-binding transcriptional regulator AlpA
MQAETNQEKLHERLPVLSKARKPQPSGKTHIGEYADEELLTPDEGKTVLKLPSTNWIYQRIHTNTLPFPYVKVGHYVRFPAAGIRKYIERQTQNGTAA